MMIEAAIWFSLGAFTALVVTHNPWATAVWTNFKTWLRNIWTSMSS